MNQRVNLTALSQPIYDGEEVTTQGDIDLVALTGLPAMPFSGALDEPLTRSQVLNIFHHFIHGGLDFSPTLPDSRMKI